MFHDRQAEAGSARHARARLVDAVEPFEDARELFSSDSFTGVRDIQPERAVLPCADDANFSARLVVQDCIVDEIGYSGGKANTVRMNLIGGTFIDDSNIALRQDRLTARNLFVDNRLNVHAFLCRRQFGLNTRQC